MKHKAIPVPIWHGDNFVFYIPLYSINQIPYSLLYLPLLYNFTYSRTLDTIRRERLRVWDWEII